MSLVGLVLLAAALVLLAAAEWPRVAGSRAGGPPRRRRKSHLRVVEPDDSDEFARAVERDLAKLPTIDDRD